MLKLLLIFSLLICCSLGTFWESCGFNIPQPNWVESPECTADHCNFTRGANLNISTWFRPTYSQRRLDAFIIANNVYPLPLDPPHDDACNSLWVDGGRHSCPTFPGQEVEWRINAPIGNDLPHLTDARIESDFFKILIDFKINLIYL